MNAGPFVLAALATGVATAALAQDRTALPSSGSIKIHSGWKANGDGVQVAENHLLFSGVVWLGHEANQSYHSSTELTFKCLTRVHGMHRDDSSCTELA